MEIVIPMCFLTVSNFLTEEELTGLKERYGNDAFIDKCYSMISFASAKQSVLQEIANYLNSLDCYKCEHIEPYDIIKL